MAARQNKISVPTGTDQQRRCARDWNCSAKTRDPETFEWTPAAGNPLCVTDSGVLVQYLGELPGIWHRLGEAKMKPAKTGRAVRIPPGSRVLIGTEPDALQQEAAAVIGGWAARVRDVPGLSLSRHGYPHGSQEQVTEDCRVLALHHVPLLALAPGEMLRTWTFAPAKPGPAAAAPAVGQDRRPGPPAPRPARCRRCSLLLTPSPSGKYWWPASCTHAGAVPVLVPAEDASGDPLPPVTVAHQCRACGKKLPAAWQPPRCRHEPASAAAPAPDAIPAEIEAEVAGLEIVYSGDGWVSCLTSLGGEDAALDVFDLRKAGVLLLAETPAPAEGRDGVPCRECDRMSSLEVLPFTPPDPGKPEPPFIRCSKCRAVMTRTQYDDWTRQYDAYARGAGIKTCQRCERGLCSRCQWDRCSCRAAGHKRAA
jgi:hypothetical protein